MKIFKSLLFSICIIGFLGGLLIYPFSFPNPETKKDDGVIRVMSYNVKNSYQDRENFHERKAEVVKLIQDYRPDSIGLQEAAPVWIEYLQKNLQDYSFVGVGRDDGENVGEYTPIFYLKDTYELLSQETKWLSETPDIPSIGWDASSNRIYTVATLKHKMSGEIYSHYNTHLDHKGKIAREKGLQLITKKIQENTHNSVLSGDFNFLQGFAEYKRIDSSIQDSKYLAEKSASFGTINYFLNLNFRFLPPIDYIFVKTGSFRVKSYAVIQNALYNGKQISDHYAVVVDLYREK